VALTNGKFIELIIELAEAEVCPVKMNLFKNISFFGKNGWLKTEEL
jgi:hypothetical protein